MAQGDIIANIIAVTGKVFIKAPDGQLRAAKPGDALREGEILVTAADGRVELAPTGGLPFAIGPDQTVRVTADLSETTRPQQADAQVNDATIQQVIQALNNGGDLTAVLEATAAGLGGGAEGDGNSFVRLLRIVEGVDPLAFQFSSTERARLDEFTGGDQQPDPVNLSITVDLEEEGIEGGNDEADGGASVRSGNLLDGTAGAGGTISAINVPGFAPVAVAPSGTSIGFDQRGLPIDSGSEARPAVLVTIFPDGRYTIEMLDNLLVSGEGENLVTLPSFSLTGTAANGGQLTVGVGLTVQDDVPEMLSGEDRESFGSTDVISVDEDGFERANTDDRRDGELDGGGALVASGSIQDNASWGADGFGGVTGVRLGEQSAEFDETAGAYVIENDQFRFEVEAASGSYRFTLKQNALMGGAGEVASSLFDSGFEVSAQDADGDPLPQPIRVSVNVFDDIPVLVAERRVSLQVDEDDVATELSVGSLPNDGDEGDGSTTGNPDSLNGPAYATANLSSLVSFGADGLGTSGGFGFADSLSALTGLGLSSGGQVLSYAVSGGVLTATAGEGEAARTVFTVALDRAGQLTFALFDQLDHAAPESGADENPLEIDLGSVIEAADGDGDAVSLASRFSVTVKDDIPSVQVAARAVDETDALVVDETVFGTDVTAEFADNFKVTLGAGADDEAQVISTGYALSVGGGATGLVDVATGQEIVLALVAGAVEGRVGSETGATAFVVSVDETGVVKLDQRRAMEHVNPADANEPVSLANADLIVLTQTSTVRDADGDTVTGSASLGIAGTMTFRDDGPTVDPLRLSTAGSVATDETTQLGVAVSGLAAIFTGGSVSYGADGSGSTDAQLRIVGDGASGLVTTVGSKPITLVADSANKNVVYGRYDGAGEGDLDGTAFTIALADDGKLTVTQAVALRHPDATNPDDPVNLAGKLEAAVVATDRDGDRAEQSVQIGSAIVFEDDGPRITVANLLPRSESFETFTNLINNWAVVGEGGTTITGDNGIVWMVNGAGIEIQEGNVGGSTASDGTAKAELDAHDSARNGGSTLVTLATVVNVSSSGSLVMSFDYKPRPGSESDSSMTVSIGGKTVTISNTGATGPADVAIESTTGANGWTTYRLAFTGLTGTQTLAFTGTGKSDTLGAYIDNIRLDTNRLVVDETNLAGDASSATGGTAFTVDFGADGAAASNSKVHALVASEGAVTGLTDTASGRPVLISLGTGTDTGKVFGMADGKVVFVMSVDAATGVVSFDQQRAVVHANASNPNDAVTLNAGVIALQLTATDGDGDPVSASVDVGRLVSIFDDGPRAAGSADTIAVDEDGLSGANADAGRSGETTGTGSASATGSIVDNVNWGNDGFGRVTGVMVGTTSGTWDATAKTYTISNDDYSLVVEEDGDYTLTLKRAQTHSGQGEDLKALLESGFIVNATDKDGDAVPGGVRVNVDVRDDIPVIDVASAVTYTLTVTNYGSDAGYNNSFGYYIKDANGNPTSGKVLWDNVKAFNTSTETITGYTPDQVGFFIIPDGDRLNAGLTAGTPVTFVRDVNGNWQAVVGSSPLLGRDANVLFDVKALNVDGLDHARDTADPGSLNWEDIRGGGDGDYNDINIGVSWTSNLSVLTTQDRDTIGEAFDTASVSFADAFSQPTSRYGADGAGKVDTSYALSVQGTGTTGLFSDGVAITLVKVDDEVLGRAGSADIFKVGVNAAGLVTLTQYAEIDHLGEQADGSAINNSVSLLGLPYGVLALTQTVTITDGDGDTATDSQVIDIGTSIRFEDDLPLAVNDIDTVAGGTATGNVLTGIGNSGGAADTVGADDDTLVSGVQGATRSGSAFVAQGVHGTLTLNPDGSYTYVASPKLASVSVNASYGSGGNVVVKAYELGESFFDTGGKLTEQGASTTEVTQGGAGNTFFGVSGSSSTHTGVPTQVNYSGSLSQALSFGFGGLVTSATVSVSNLFQNENGGEAARWHAFDAAGNRIGTGVISQNESNEPYANTTTVTWNTTGAENVGTFTVSGIGGFATLVIEGVPYSENGYSATDDSDFFARVDSFMQLPNGGAYSDTFTYTITDGDGDSSTATLTINGTQVPPAGTPVNAAPNAADNSYNVGRELASVSGNIITDDQDGAGAATGRDWDQDTPVQNLSIHSVIVSGVAEPILVRADDTSIKLPNGTLIIDPNGEFTYTADRNAVGSDSFQYVLQDVNGKISAPATVTFDLPEVVLTAWNDNTDDGDLNAGDNQAKAFVVTSEFIQNQASASNWIGDRLREGRALTGAQVTASSPRELTLAVTSPITFTFLSEGASYKNAVGWYDMNKPSEGHVVWSNASAAGSGGSLVAGVSTVIVPNVPEGTRLAFFMIPDANNGSLPKTVYFQGGKAYTDAAFTQLIPSAANGKDEGAVWFSNPVNGSPNVNLDGLQHAVTGLASGQPASRLYVGFEDVPGGGDRDYNDVVFTVDLGRGIEVRFDPVEFDLGVDIAFDGPLQSAAVAFTLGDDDAVYFDAALATARGLAVTQDAASKTFTITSKDATPNAALDFEDVLDTFRIEVGHTGANDDPWEVDAVQRKAAITVTDTSGNTSAPIEALFNLTVSLPNKPDDNTV